MNWFNTHTNVSRRRDSWKKKFKRTRNLQEGRRHVEIAQRLLCLAAGGLVPRGFGAATLPITALAPGTGDAAPRDHRRRRHADPACHSGGDPQPVAAGAECGIQGQGFSFPPKQKSDGCCDKKRDADLRSNPSPMLPQ